MAKPPVTLQQRLGFQDADLCKPWHDQIMTWLGKVAPAMLPAWLGRKTLWQIEIVERLRNNAEKVLLDRINELKELIRTISSTKTEIRNTQSPLIRELSKYSKDDARIEKLASALRDLETIDLTPPSKPPVPEMEGAPVWEYPLNSADRGGKPHIIGFADMLIRYRLPRVELNLGDLSVQRFPDWQNSGGPLEKPSYIQWTSCQAYFEVKTEIPSLGELMRQLQFYRQYLKGDWFVVSPDTRFKETLAEQGIGFVEYRPTNEDITG